MYSYYRSIMPETLPHQITIEKTPSYFVTGEVPSRIFKMSNSTKLVLVVRDPVTRAVSDYTQILSKHGKSKSFQSSAFLRNDTSRINTSWIVIRIGLYVKHLENWLSVFPLRQIHFVHGENLVTNPGEEMRKVQEFLGLEPVITEKHFFFDKRRGFPCIKKKLTNKRGHCLDESKGRPHPLLPAKVISSLRRFYRPFNEKFYKLTNIDFKWPWTSSLFAAVCQSRSKVWGYPNSVTGYVFLIFTISNVYWHMQTIGNDFSYSFYSLHGFVPRDQEGY